MSLAPGSSADPSGEGGAGDADGDQVVTAAGAATLANRWALLSLVAAPAPMPPSGS